MFPAENMPYYRFAHIENIIQLFSSLFVMFHAASYATMESEAADEAVLKKTRLCFIEKNIYSRKSKRRCYSTLSVI